MTDESAKLVLPRRSVLLGLGNLLAVSLLPAPAIVRAASLMPVRAFSTEVTYSVRYSFDQDGRPEPGCVITCSDGRSRRSIHRYPEGPFVPWNGDAQTSVIAAISAHHKYEALSTTELDGINWGSLVAKGLQTSYKLHP